MKRETGVAFGFGGGYIEQCQAGTHSKLEQKENAE